MLHDLPANRPSLSMLRGFLEVYREAGANIILHNLVKIRLLHQTRAKKWGLVKFFASIEWRSCSPMVNEAVFCGE